MATCPKCGGANISYQAVLGHQLVKAHHSIIWWIFVGWWWVPIKWICFTLPALVVWLFHPKRAKIKYEHMTRAVCQSCGYSWNVKQ